MNREELDAFFAKADDVLTDWQGGVDAMHGVAPSEGAEDDLGALVDSYYDETAIDWFPEFSRVMFSASARLGEAIRTFSDAIQPVLANYYTQVHQLGTTPTFVVFDETHVFEDETAMQRALRLRRTRNTGPDDPYRLTRRRAVSA